MINLLIQDFNNIHNNQSMNNQIKLINSKNYPYNHINKIDLTKKILYKNNLNICFLIIIKICFKRLMMIKNRNFQIYLNKQ